MTQQPESPPPPATPPSGPVVPPEGSAHPRYLPPAEPVPAIAPPGGPFLTAAVPPPPPDGRWRPERVDPVVGTEFGLVQLHVAPIASGLATGSLVAGIGSIGVSFLVLCFGLAGSSDNWGGWVAGAFTLLGVLVGGGAAALGVVALRQIRRSHRPGQIRFTGRGAAIAGICCGAVGAGISLAALALAVVLQLS